MPSISNQQNEFARGDKRLSCEGAKKLLEDLRRKAATEILRMKTFAACWPVWKAEIDTRTRGLTDPSAIYALGSQLRDIFKLTAQAGRGQGDLSGGGAAWEGLVCWYLNLVMTDTRAVVIKQNKTLIPSCLSDAMAVNYKNVRTNTESDLSGIIFPKSIQILSGRFEINELNNFVAQNISKISLHNIQCKTNWNDNAQIPMLWDMIYSFRGVKDHKVRVGANGFDLDDLKEFTYSFVALPSQTKDIKPNSMAVRRVESLSGGNYWGKPSQSGVADGLSEIFKKVFKDAFDRDIRGHISMLIQNGRISFPDT